MKVSRFLHLSLLFLSLLSILTTIPTKYRSDLASHGRLDDAIRDVDHEEVANSPLLIDIDSYAGLKLTVPFFVYPSNSSLNWMDMFSTDNGAFRKHKRTYKHGDDFWMLHSAMKHPMRTLNPREAKLFFVPTLLNAAAYIPSDGRKNMTFNSFNEALLLADRELGKSIYFQEHSGNDHIVVFSTWVLSDLPASSLPNLYSCNMINFEGKRPWLPRPRDRRANLITIPSTYIGNPCHHDSPVERTDDFVMVASIHTDDGRKRNFSQRAEICRWLHQGNYKVSLCGPGAMCPAIAKARYGFHEILPPFPSFHSVERDELPCERKLLKRVFQIFGCYPLQTGPRVYGKTASSRGPLVSLG